MIEPTGANLVAGRESRRGAATLRATDPASGRTLDPAFSEATAEEVDTACEAAASAAAAFAATGPERRAAFLERIGEEIEGLGDVLLARCEAETALPRQRLEAERARTVGQLAMFAALVREGSWVDARIDTARPERQPLPRPDLRRMRVALGPVAVFGASNFPLAFSVAGGDTAAALAAGCPVVVKGHPAHPGTSELVGCAIVAAAAATGMPAGVSSLLQGVGHEVGTAMAAHPAIRAVGFTGSLGGGRALFDVAARRPDPIPVFAEMGSSNPVFVLPGALAERGAEIAAGLAASVTQGAGQFCTNPGLTVIERGAPADAFAARLGERLGAAGPLTVVHAGIGAAYEEALTRRGRRPGVETVARAAAGGAWEATSATAALLATDAATFLADPALQEELYGPATVLVRCADGADMVALASRLGGHLTATVHGTEADLDAHEELLRVLREKAGRLIVNGFPTGVEVAPAMHHGGPWPATTDPRFTSVGSAAIERFARPVCFQGFPDRLLPPELQDANPRGIWRLVDGEPTRSPIAPLARP